MDLFSELFKWLSPKEIAQLDTAVSNRALRALFLNAIKHLVYPNLRPFEKYLEGCGPRCTRNHDGAKCLACKGDWGQHSGHVCPSPRGGRGSFRRVQPTSGKHLDWMAQRKVGLKKIIVDDYPLLMDTLVYFGDRLEEIDLLKIDNLNNASLCMVLFHPAPILTITKLS